MPRKLRAERVSLALNNIETWRNAAKSQGATHLLPLLALIERGAADPPGKATLMNETPHEFEFWDKYFRLNDLKQHLPDLGNDGVGKEHGCVERPIGFRPSAVRSPSSSRRLNPTVRKRAITPSRSIPVPSSSMVMVSANLSIVT